jgi:hypothetical protein
MGLYMMDKQIIIEEIKRTAASNGGVPFGTNRFLTETGIKVSDWRGIYWINWGDALLEAGYSPNSWQTAYDENSLIEKLIIYIREIGHFPVKAEIMLKHRTDPSFPSQSPFRRIGSKNQLTEKVLIYCRNNPGNEDIIKICEGLPKRQDADLRGGEPDFNKDGFVYLMKSGRYYKIGRSNHPGRREYDLALQMPEKLNKIHEIRTDDPCGIEAYWHNRFASKRKGGEWFDLDSSDIQAFKRRKHM